MAEFIHKCKVDEVTRTLSSPVDHLFASVSYEERALTLWNELHEMVRSHRFLCYNQNHLDYLEKNLEKAKTLEPRATVVPLNSDNPVFTFDALQAALRQIGGMPCRVGVDVTGFTRETLAVLLFLLTKILANGSTIVFFYHKAAAYGSSPQGGWLSQGVSDVRTILGYSGSVRLSSNTHLVLLPGYEFERASAIIDAIQPSRLTLGFVRSENSVSSELNATLLRYISRLRAFYSHWEIGEFEFSSVDAFATRDSVTNYLARQKVDENVVIASLNSKPATIGVCLAVLNNPQWQLVYAQARIYNVAGYSSPSNELLLFEVPVVR